MVATRKCRRRADASHHKRPARAAGVEPGPAESTRTAGLEPGPSGSASTAKLVSAAGSVSTAGLIRAAGARPESGGSLHFNVESDRRERGRYLEIFMRLVTFRAEVCAPARLGALVDDYVVDLALLGDDVGQDLPSDMLSFIDLGPQAVRSTTELLASYQGQWPVGTAVPVVNVKLLAPIPRPRKNIFGIGLNYVEHVAESSRSLDTAKDLPKQPVIFSKPPTTVIGPGDAVQHNKELTQQLDWRSEPQPSSGRGPPACPKPRRSSTCSATA